MSSYDRSFTAAQIETRRRLRELYAAEYPPGSPLNDLHAFYTACMNITAIDERGAEPIRGQLARIDSIETADDLSAVLEEMWAMGASPFFKLDASVSLVDRSEKVLTIKAGARALKPPQYTGWPVPDVEWDTPGADLADFRNLSAQGLVRPRLSRRGRPPAFFFPRRASTPVPCGCGCLHDGFRVKPRLGIAAGCGFRACFFFSFP